MQSISGKCYRWRIILVGHSGRVKFSMKGQTRFGGSDPIQQTVSIIVNLASRIFSQNRELIGDIRETGVGRKKRIGRGVELTNFIGG